MMYITIFCYTSSTVIQKTQIKAKSACQFLKSLTIINENRNINKHKHSVIQNIVSSKSWGAKGMEGKRHGGAKDQGAKDQGAKGMGGKRSGGKRSGGKRPEGKRPGGKRPGGKSPVTSRLWPWPSLVNPKFAYFGRNLVIGYYILEGKIPLLIRNIQVKVTHNPSQSVQPQIFKIKLSI